MKLIQSLVLDFAINKTFQLMFMHAMHVSFSKSINVMQKSDLTSKIKMYFL